MDVRSAKILLGYRTDHSQIALQFDFVKFEKDKSYWKFNNSLLKDQNYVGEIKDLIKFTKLNYVQFDEYMNENNINAISDHHLRFSVSDQLFFDILLMEIRGKTISYTSFKKKKEID